MIPRWSIGALLVLFVSCDRSPFPDHTRVEEDVHLRLHRLGEGDAAPGAADSVLLRIRLARRGAAPGSSFSTERWYLAGDLAKAGLDVVLNRMVVGDSMSILFRNAAFQREALGTGAAFPVKDTTWLSMELLLLRMRTPEERKAEELAFQRSHPEAYDARTIARYMGDDSATWTRWGTSLLHYRILDPGRHDRPIRAGEVVTLRYEGRFLHDGKVFDDGGGGEGFTYPVGEPGQVIRGLEVAVSLLHEGGRGEFLVPSSMAFGPRGGAGGLVPPNTPVHYHVEVIGVQR